MDLKVLREIIEYDDLKVEAFIILPPEGKEVLAVSAFTHGYTSYKGAVLSFAQRLADLGVISIAFDLPGHFLGSFTDLDSFEDFKTKSHYLFFAAFLRAKEILVNEYGYAGIDLEKIKLVLGGHSLGALMAFKALKLPEFNDVKKCGIFVGFGMNREEEHSIHALQSPLYKDVLKFREQLVSEYLRGDSFFSWLKKEKSELKGKNLELLFIGGEDDFIAPPKSVEIIVKDLKSQGNKVTHLNKKKLPHHVPEMATPHIASYVKEFLSRT